MEFLGFVDGIKNVASAWAIAAGTGDPRATVVADVFHMMRGGGSVDDLLTLSRRPHGLLSISMTCRAEPDPLTQKDEDRVMVGDGIADLPRVIANLRTIGYRGPLSLELFNQPLVGTRSAPGRQKQGSSGFELWSRVKRDARSSWQGWRAPPEYSVGGRSLRSRLASS